MSKISVLLADDHAIVSQGLEALLSTSFRLVGSVADGRALVAAVAQLKPDVVVTDISMPGLNGMDAIRQVKQNSPATKIVALTMHSDAVVVNEALKAGASGYVLKVAKLEELEKAIQEAMAGRTYLCPQIARGFPHAFGAPKERALTARQKEVLQLIGEGRTMKEIANVLGISPRTAEAHKYDMMEVLGCKTTADLVRHAVRLRLV